jgi:hypothetical protein
MPTPTSRIVKIVVLLSGLTAASLMLIERWRTPDVQPGGTLPLEKALWVSDWDITKIYGPGTPEQQAIVQRLKATEAAAMTFSEPVLYRSGGSQTTQGNQGIVMIPFNPKDPKAALVLKR